MEWSTDATFYKQLLYHLRIVLAYFSCDTESDKFRSFISTISLMNDRVQSVYLNFMVAGSRPSDLHYCESILLVNVFVVTFTRLHRRPMMRTSVKESVRLTPTALAQ
ncbi:hypothetical membrane protein [Trichinella spiralis]|uniref:hypothetical membrane protein n=1 Tax=Trichinella spiralis TaxID=6334 RepID=UPI0001EFC39C|nr:hypothetical membrane protein [Trichinella spiralis]